MHPTEPKDAFLHLRANGWSLRSIAEQLRIPKSTLFDWEADPPTRRLINVLKSMRIEKLQEKFIPSFEDELQRTSSLLNRVESALGVQDFFSMRPEFLLRMSVQLRTRLQKLRCDVHPVETLRNLEPPSNPRPGCISRSETIGDSGERRCSLSPIGGEGQGEGASSPSPLNGERAGLPAEGLAKAGVRGETVREGSDATTPSKPDTSQNSCALQPSTPATCDDQNRTPVRNEHPQPAHEPSHEPAPPLLPPNNGRDSLPATPTPAIHTKDDSEFAFANAFPSR